MAEKDFEVVRDGTTLNVLLSKELSYANATTLTDEMLKYSGQGIEKVVFDATVLMFLSSSGIRSLLFAYQDLGNRPEIVFVNCAKEIFQVLDHVGLTSFIKFEESSEKRDQYRQKILYEISMRDAEKGVEERKNKLEQFATDNDVVCYSMKMGEED